MRVKLRISTPKGQAKKTERRIKGFIIGFKKVKLDTYVNDEDNQMIWDIEGNYRDIFKIIKNATMFETYISRIMDNKLMKKTVLKKLEPGQREELEHMLENQTKLEVIKEATSTEIIDGKSWWERTREKFQKFKSYN